MIAAEEGGRIAVAPAVIPPGVLITARSYLIDRVIPQSEMILLPEKVVPGGAIPWTLTDHVPASKGGGVRQRTLGRFIRRREPASVPLGAGGDLALDVRGLGPANWAHFLNLAVPLAVMLTRRLSLPGIPVMILPADIPGHVLRAAACLGLAVQATNAAVKAPAILPCLANNILRPERRDWVEAWGLPDRIAAAGPGAALPERVFLARRDTRRIANQPEIEALLGARGFVTLYPEDLPVADQFGLFNAAREIVAIHGAGLAPLLFRQAQAPLRLVEILPCGHMTDVYRAMAAQTGCDWIGVRGRLKPEYVQDAYRLGQMFTRFSLDDFEVDPVALKQALDYAP